MTTALVGYYEGDVLRLRYRANAAPSSLDAFVLFEYDKYPGVAYKDTVPMVSTFTTTWAEVLTEADPAGGGGPGGPPGCKIVGGGVQLRSSATSLVKGSMYVRLVIARQTSAYEECLCCGYIYDAKPFLSVGEHGDLDWSEAVAFMNVSLDQGNVAGGAVVVEVVPGAGSAFDVLACTAVNSGTNGLRQATQTAAAGSDVSVYSVIASGAATVSAIPQMTTNSGTSQRLVTSASPSPPRVTGTQSYRIGQTVAGAQGDNLDVLMTIRVRGALPTVSKANSTNEADVTVAAGALSFAFIN